MAGDDTDRGAPVNRNLSTYSDETLLATWRKTARELARARTEFASEYLRAKIKGESDGTAKQIATEVTRSETTLLESDLDIVKAIWYARGRKETT